jgi:cellulose synthase/poly-beta-1,6-N-acetylglucosamine synthase-like glycosyltransferase
MKSYLLKVHLRAADQRPMIQYEPDSTATPLFSVVMSYLLTTIGYRLTNVCSPWRGKRTRHNFEVIVADNASRETAPEHMRTLARFYALTIIRQSHKRISAARNQGIQGSKGAILLFVGADCRLQTNSLAALSSAISRSPQHE